MLSLNLYMRKSQGLSISVQTLFTAFIRHHLFMLFPLGGGGGGSSRSRSPSIRSAKLNSIWESVDRACPRANIASDLSNARATLSCCHLLVLQGYIRSRVCTTVYSQRESRV